MTNSPSLKRTALYPWHLAHSAHIATFGGYEMPLWYPHGTKNEHLAVVTAAGLFDTSHMAVLTLEGAAALPLLQRCFTKDLNRCLGRKKEPLRPGYCVYGAFLNEEGHCLDDAIVYHFAPNSYGVVVNASMGGVIASHLQEQSPSEEVRITDYTDKFGKMDLQGPAAAAIIKEVLREPESALRDLSYFSFKGQFLPHHPPVRGEVRLLDNTPILLSRTGYTGEYGFEIFTAPEATQQVWETLLAAGKKHGLLTCGLAARDSLRTGAVLPLSHQDIGHWLFRNHPWNFALPYDEQGQHFTKDFIGAAALLDPANDEHTYPFVGHDPRKVLPHDGAVVINANGEQIGQVLTCTTDMAIDWQGDRIYSLASPDKPQDFTPRGLCCGFIKVNQPLPTGQQLTLKDTRRIIKVAVVADIRPNRTARR